MYQLSHWNSLFDCQLSIVDKPRNASTSVVRFTSTTEATLNYCYLWDSGFHIHNISPYLKQLEIVVTMQNYIMK